MLDSTRTLLRLPGLGPYLAVSQSARIAFAALVPGLLIVVNDRRAGGYGLAGVAVAALAIGSVLSGPVKGRLIDRHGLRIPLALMAAGTTLALAGLLVAMAPGATSRTVLLVGSAFLLGTGRPALGTYSRLLWARTLDPARDGGKLLEQAMAVESTLAGSAILLGPLLLTGLLLVLAPTEAFAAIAVLLALSVALLACLRAVRNVAPSRPRGIRTSPWSALADWHTIVASAALFGALAGAPLVVVARAGDLGASLLISVMAAGAIAAAVPAAMGAIPARMLGIVGPLVALAGVGLMLVDAVPLVVAVAAFGAGCGLIEIAINTRVVSAADNQQAEAMSWRTNAGAVGQAAGAALVGLLVATDVRLSPVAIAALVVASTVFGVGMLRLRAASGSVRSG
jgi:MFS family permease